MAGAARAADTHTLPTKMPLCALPAPASLHRCEAQPTNYHCLVKQHSDINVNITFIMLILIKQSNKKNVKNESTLALFEGKLLNSAESIFNIQISKTRPTLAFVSSVTVK